MSLLPELQAAVDQAQAGDLRGLHLMILGPSPSGKSTQAHAYAEALVEKGLAGSMREFDFSRAKYVGIAGQMFNEAKGGVLLIDELEKSAPELRREILFHVLRAISDGDTLVIITGAASLENDVASDPGLQRRMNKPIILDKQFTRAEMDAFNADRRSQRDIAKAERKKQEDRALRVAEWKAAKNEDLRPQTPIAAPKTARFRKPEVAS